MNINGFEARSDIVGRRIRVAWEFVPAAGETLADIPPVTLRRKPRDFAYPTVSPDPYLVYASGSFPPGPIPNQLTVTDLNGWETVRGTERYVYEPISVAVPVGGRFVEILRRTTVTIFDLNGFALRQRVEIVDVGPSPGALTANVVYYYQLFSINLPVTGDPAEPYRSTAMVTDSYGQNRFLYHSLPEIYRRHDVVTSPVAPGSESVPELMPNFGQLRRFLDVFGIAADSLRGTAEGLRGLHDVDNVDAQFLPLIAQWIGWDLSLAGEIPLQRNELKAANRLFKLVGAIPGLRALVTQYTGWYSQVAEFAQNITRSNQPARRNLYAATMAGDGVNWFGVDDAAEALGFPATNQKATGTATTAATLTGSSTEPFSLRSGMTLTLAADGLPSVSVRFGPGDFADITQATAKEVTAAINRALPDITAQATSGQMVIASDTVGVLSLLEVVPEPTSLVSLENCPNGRLSASTDSVGRVRVFYEAWGTPTQPAATLDISSSSTAAMTGNYVLQQIRYKTFVDGGWRDSQPMFANRVTPQSDPGALVLPDDRVWTAWLDDPLTSTTRLRWSLGTSQTPLPARLLGRKSEPFTLAKGSVLTLVGNWSGVDRYTVKTADFLDLTKATAAEVVAAMNGQLNQNVAKRESDGSISLSTKATGAAAWVNIDLKQSTTARALGFDPRNAGGTPGSWSEVIDWSDPLDAPSIPAGYHAEIATVNDPVGGVRIAWAAHGSGSWRIRTAHWNDQTLVATSNGVFLRSSGGLWVSVPGLPSIDIRAIAVDSNGSAWIATAAGVSLRHPDGTIAALVPEPPSLDVRHLVLGLDGTAYLATAIGIVIRAPGGSTTSLTTAQGLPSNDIRSLVILEDGTLWAATAAGAVLRGPDGSLQVFNTATGLPSNMVQGIAIDESGTIYIATTMGLAISMPGGGFAITDSTNGLGSSDARAVAVAPDGTIWVATAGGVSFQLPNGPWTIIDSAEGLNSNDTLAISIAPDGSAWVGTASGICTIANDGTVGTVDLLNGGGINPAGRAVQTGWAAPLELVSNGGGGSREPSLVVDSSKQIWLIWSERVGVGTINESWGLHYRIYNPTTLSWGLDTILTSPPVGGRSADRTPGGQSQPSGIRVYFASDRTGGFSLWSVDVSLLGSISTPVALPDRAASDLAPTPITIGIATWVIYRSDDNVSLAQTSPFSQGSGLPQSERVHDAGTIRRYAGSVAVDLNDLNRLRTRLVYGDLLNYTPNRPDGVGTLADDELYTRGTIGLYVSRANSGAELTSDESLRVREQLQDFIPINMRALVILVESATVESLYPDGNGPQDSYSDDYPYLSTYGSITDSTSAAIPDLSILQSNRLTSVSANPANLKTLSGRTFFPGLQ